jgi:type IV fimbrial biogenesis protein FimT
MSDVNARSAWQGGSRGFTLIELMITILVAAILLGVALPEFRTTINNNRMANTSNDLVNAMNIARAEAISRGSAVSVCASADGAACSASTAWNAGWIVFTDTGVAGTVDGTDAVLRVWPGLQSADSLVTAVKFVSFSAQGAASTQALFTLKPNVCVGTQHRDIDLQLSGRISLRRLPCP